MGSATRQLERFGKEDSNMLSDLDIKRDCITFNAARKARNISVPYVYKTCKGNV